MDDGGAYGAGKATGSFDPLTYVRKPQVILRAISWVFSIIVFGCISSQGYWRDTCAYNQDPNACGYGVAIGVLAFLGLMGFLILDALFDNISSVQQRKYIVIADIGFSGAWGFLYFVCFCYLTDQWRKTTFLKGHHDVFGVSGVQAAIAFSFFSIGSFGGLCALAVLRYRQGVSEQFASGYEPDVMGGAVQPTPSPYSSYPSAGGVGVGSGVGGGESGDPYQQAPFSAEPPHAQRQAPGDFQPPTY